MKKELLFLSIIISALFVVVIYFDLHRFAEMHFRSPNRYLKYNDLDRADKDKVIICIRSDNDDVSKPFLNSLLDQTVKVDAIWLNQKNDKRLDPDVKKFVNIYKNSKKYDNSHAFISSLLNERSSNTKIILVDADMIYGPDYIEEMVNLSNKNPNSVVYGNKNMGIKGGILYTTESFNDNIFNKFNTLEERINNCSLNNIDLNYIRIYKKINY